MKNKKNISNWEIWLEHRKWSQETTVDGPPPGSVHWNPASESLDYQIGV